jgi:hypothetical protein
MPRGRKITTPFSKRTPEQRTRIAMARGKRKGFARAARAARSPIRGLGGERRAMPKKSDTFMSRLRTRKD